jgi:hypothetical protein
MKSMKSKALVAVEGAFDFASMAWRPPSFCLRFRFLSAAPRVCSEDEETAAEGAGLGVAVVIAIGLVLVVVCI